MKTIAVIAAIISLAGLIILSVMYSPIKRRLNNENITHSGYANAANQMAVAANIMANAAATANKPTTNKDSEISTKATFSSDLTGQVARILAEGNDDATISKNIAGIDKAITYAHLKKNAAKYAGEPWAFTGKILEITEKDGMTAARISIDDWAQNVLFVSGMLTTEFVEKDRVYVVGYLAGDYSYTSQANWKITIPSLAIRAVIKPKDVAKYTKRIKPN